MGVPSAQFDGAEGESPVVTPSGFGSASPPPPSSHRRRRSLFCCCWGTKNTVEMIEVSVPDGLAGDVGVAGAWEAEDDNGVEVKLFQIQKKKGLKWKAEIVLGRAHDEKLRLKVSHTWSNAALKLPVDP